MQPSPPEPKWPFDEQPTKTASEHLVDLARQKAKLADDARRAIADIEQQEAKQLREVLQAATHKVRQGARDFIQHGAEAELAALLQQEFSHLLSPPTPANQPSDGLPTRPRRNATAKKTARKQTPGSVTRRVTQPAASMTLPPDTEAKPRGWLIGTIKDVMKITDSSRTMHASVIFQEVQKRGYDGKLPGIINAMRSPAQAPYFHNAGGNKWYTTAEPQVDTKAKKGKRGK